MGPRHYLSFCACTTSCLASELLVSMGPSLHLWLLHAKQRLLDPKNKSLWVPDITCLLCMQYSVINSRITSLYGSQPLSVVFVCKTASFGAELQVSMGPRPQLRFCVFKRASLVPEFHISIGPRPYLSMCACKTA